MSFSLSGSTIVQSGTDTDLSGLTGITGVTTTAYNDTTEYKLDTLTLAINGTMTQTNDERLTFINGNTNAIKVNGGGTYNFGTASTFTTNAGDSVTVHPGMHMLDIGKPTGLPYVNAERGVVVLNNGTWNVLGGIIQTTKSIEIENGSTFLVRDGYFAFKSDQAFQNFYITTPDTDIVNMAVVDNMSPPSLNVGIQKNFVQLEGYNPAGTRRPLCIIDPLNIGTVLIEKYQGGGKNEVDVRLRTGSYQSQYWLYEAPIGNDLRVEGFGASKQSKGHARHYIRWNPTFKDSLSKALLQDVKVDLTDTDNGSRRTGQSPVQSPTDINYVDTSDASGVLSGAPVDVLTGVWHNNGNHNQQVYVTDNRLPVVGNCVQYLYNISSLGLTDSKVGTDSSDVLLVADATLTESTKATVDAYTSIDTPEEFYDRAKSYLYDNFNGESSTIVSRSGSQINLGAYDLNIDATAGSAFSISSNTITIKTSLFAGDLTTTGVITLLNGAEVGGIRTDANGTIVPDPVVSLTGLIANTEVRIYDATTGAELAGVENSGTSFTDTVPSASTSVNIVIHHVDYLNVILSSVSTAGGISLPISQVFDRQYDNP